MRRCNIPPSGCRHPYSTPCCKDCREEACGVRCQNAPERCNCWADKPPRQKRERKVSELQVAFLHGQAGLSVQQIADQLGCHRHTVSAILHEMGVGGRG